LTTTNGHSSDHFRPQALAPQVLPQPATSEDLTDALDALDDAHGLIRQLLDQLPDDQRWQWVQRFAMLIVTRLARSYQRRGVTPPPWEEVVIDGSWVIRLAVKPVAPGQSAADAVLEAVKEQREFGRRLAEMSEEA
jgi:hypothetical protein